jgi:predicted type IV restriction endonuclease
MDIKDQLKNLAERVEKLKADIHTEEATKNAFIMPFIQILGYDVFNPLEVVPEYISDIGIKKGEKVDYAILKDKQPIILIECKHWEESLNLHNSQLIRYFQASKTKFAILCNGIYYKFYTDLDAPNRMDEKPFLEINILDLRENQIEEIKKFHKSYFDIESIVSTASDLKYTNELKTLLFSELQNPSDPFVKLLAKQVYPGVITARLLEQFTVLTKKSFNQLLNDLITERLKSALKKETESAEKNEVKSAEVSLEEKESRIQTTTQEIEAYFVVKSILRTKVQSDRVYYRDAQTYFSIILDDNNRKPICRLYLDGKKKLIGIIDEFKKENRFEIMTIDDIYKYSDQLYKVVNCYEPA